MRLFKSKIFIVVVTLTILNVLFAFISYNKTNAIKKKEHDSAIKGITVVATPNAIGARAFEKLKSIHTEWVCFVPYGFSKKGSTNVQFNLDWQWWGEKISGVKTSIQEAKKLGLKVMLKPQVYVPDGWVGDLDFETETEWQAWEAQYKKFIFSFLNVATEMDVEMFCIGTEFTISTQKRPQFWQQLIKEARSKYSGKITYSANWDHYKNIAFWDQLDYIGISSYFPLSDEKNPSLGQLLKKWVPIRKELKNFAHVHQKKILFTEYGYMSVDGCAGKAWEIEKNKDRLHINHYAQSNAYDALWTAMSTENYWHGGFLWKWFPDGMGHEGYPEKDYTPQDKPSEMIIKKWFSTPKKG